MVVTAILQIKYLNKALQRFDSTEVIPTQFVLFTVSAIIGSAVLYHDFDGMDMQQLSRFMSGCAVEFLGVYLITSKRTKRIHTPALSNSDSGTTAVSFSDEEEALDRVNLLPSDQPRKRVSVITPVTNFENWQESNSHIVNTINHNTNRHRRHSSVFRGISMASQLLDRNDEQQGTIQLPATSSSPHKRNDASTLGNILSGITSAITSHTPYESIGTVLDDADAVEIEIPTPSTLHYDQDLDRELMPLHNNNTNNNNRRPLVHIQEDDDHRDLS